MQIPLQQRPEHPERRRQRLHLPRQREKGVHQARGNSEEIPADQHAAGGARTATRSGSRSDFANEVAPSGAPDDHWRMSAPNLQSLGEAAAWYRDWLSNAALPLLGKHGQRREDRRLHGSAHDRRRTRPRGPTRTGAGPSGLRVRRCSAGRLRPGLAGSGAARFRVLLRPLPAAGWSVRNPDRRSWRSP